MTSAQDLQPVVFIDFIMYETGRNNKHEFEIGWQTFLVWVAEKRAVCLSCNHRGTPWLPVTQKDKLLSIWIWLTTQVI